MSPYMGILIFCTKQVITMINKHDHLWNTCYFQMTLLDFWNTSLQFVSTNRSIHPFCERGIKFFPFLLGTVLSGSVCSLKPLQAPLCLPSLTSSSSSSLVIDPVTGLRTGSPQCNKMIKLKASSINQPEPQSLYLASFCLGSHIFKIWIAFAAKICQHNGRETWKALSTAPGM